MSKDREYEQNLNNLDMSDQQALNAYMDDLDLEYNDDLDEYLEHIEEQQNAIAERQEGRTEFDAYKESEQEVEDFQDYEPYVDTIRYKGEEEPQAADNVSNGYALNDGTTDYNNMPREDADGYEGARDKTVSGNEAGNIGSDSNTGGSNTGSYRRANNFYDDYDKEDGFTTEKISDEILYIDGVPRKVKAPAIIAVALILLVIGGGVFAAYHFTDGFKDFAFLKEEATTEETTEKATTEEITEEATTEEPAGPYATVDYTLHDPHATDSTIVYNSNPYSLRYPAEEWPIVRDDNGDVKDPGQEDLYPAITLEPVEGSLNYTDPVPDNVAETQQLTSKYMVLVDLSDDTIVAARDSDVVVNPASMTKVLTVLTAADMITDLDDTFVMTPDAIQYAYDTGCSAVGFIAGETVTVRDLIYGTIVCSGADAAVGLAQYCCGSQDAFVEKMNEKAEELQISNTAHFTNAVGVYNEDLHCTMEDMAVILSTAMQNDLLREVLNTRIYQTTPDPNVLPEEVRKELGIGQESTASSSEDQAADGTDQAGESTDGTDAGTEGTDQTGVSPDGADAETEGTDQSGAPADGTEQTDVSSDGTDAETEGTGQADMVVVETGLTDKTDEDGTSAADEVDPGLLLIATDGIQISNWFMRRIEDKDTGGEVIGAKTGFVNAAGFCCASYYKSNSGKEYICVTGDTYSSWRCIYDHVGIYRSLAK